MYLDSAVHLIQEVTAIWTAVLTVLRHNCDPIPGRRQEENGETFEPVSTPPMIQNQQMLLSDLCDHQHAAWTHSLGTSSSSSGVPATSHSAPWGHIPPGIGHKINASIVVPVNQGLHLTCGRLCTDAETFAPISLNFSACIFLLHISSIVSQLKKKKKGCLAL